MQQCSSKACGCLGGGGWVRYDGLGRGTDSIRMSDKSYTLLIWTGQNGAQHTQSIEHPTARSILDRKT